MKNSLAILVTDAWSDLDRVIEGLSPMELLEQVAGGSSFAWTVAHLTQQVDSWLNVRFQGLAPNKLIASHEFRTGSAGAAHDWTAIRAAVQQVREAATPLLHSLDHDADPVIPYDGAILWLRDRGLSLRYALGSIAMHHYLHIGEIAAKRGCRSRDEDFTVGLAVGAGLVTARVTGAGRNGGKDLP